MTVNTPNAEPTAVGWEKVAPFLITAWKQPIWVSVVLENTLKIADPSKSGIDKAMAGMLASLPLIGITAPPVIGTLAFSGQRLLLLEMEK